MRAEALLVPRPGGLYCPPGDFYVDPVRPVPRAIVTHGHSDHARAGHGAVLATAPTLAVMRLRYGEDFAGSSQPVAYGETVDLAGVRVTFRPAGHVLGSASLLVEGERLRILVSGDYKRRFDPTTPPFEPVACDVFITEATFALPVFRHPEPESEIAKLLTSRVRFPDRSHLVGAYSLGKAQRLIRLLRDAGDDEPIYIHGALAAISELYAAFGVNLGELRLAVRAHARKSGFAGALVLAPPNAINDNWTRSFADPVVGLASGWMRIRQRAKQRGVELPIVLSDHADWDELTQTIAEIAPAEVWVTHGREEALTRWCALAGIAARPLHMVGYSDEDDAPSGEGSDAQTLL